MKGAVVLSSWVKDSSKAKTPFNIGNGVEEDVFQWFEASPRHGRRFHEAMTGGGALFPSSIFLNGAFCCP